jgi:hypothetical protein
LFCELFFPAMECDREPNTVDDSMEVDDSATESDDVTTWQFSQLKGVIDPAGEEIPAEGA